MKESKALKGPGAKSNGVPMYPEVTKLKLGPLNDQLTCRLCFGYLIDATTLVECQEPHSFCRSCLLKYLETSGNCPLCETEINLSLPTDKLMRPDRTLQDLVYKLVPGLYKNELKRRKDFYTSFCQQSHNTPSANSKGAQKIFDSHLVDLATFICSADEQISFSLEYYGPPEKKESESSQSKEADHSKTQKSKETTDGKVSSQEKMLNDLKFKRYFRCPAAVTVHHLKKLLTYKLELPPKYCIEISYSNEPLEDSYSLMDLAYIYTWRRKSPMQLFFHIYKPEKDEVYEPMPLLLAQASPPLRKADAAETAPMEVDPEPVLKIVGVPKSEDPQNASDRGKSTITLPSLAPVVTIEESASKTLPKASTATSATVSVPTPTKTTPTSSDQPPRKKRKPSAPTKKVKKCPDEKTGEKNKMETVSSSQSSVSSATTKTTSSPILTSPSCPRTPIPPPPLKPIPTMDSTRLPFAISSTMLPVHSSRQDSASTTTSQSSVLGIGRGGRMTGAPPSSSLMNIPTSAQKTSILTSLLQTGGVPPGVMTGAGGPVPTSMMHPPSLFPMPNLTPAPMPGILHSPGVFSGLASGVPALMSGTSPRNSAPPTPVPMVRTQQSSPLRGNDSPGLPPRSHAGSNGPRRERPPSSVATPTSSGGSVQSGSSPGISMPPPLIPHPNAAPRNGSPLLPSHAPRLFPSAGLRPHIIPAFLGGSDSSGPRVPGVLVFNDPRNPAVHAALVAGPRFQ